uniref:ATP synthase F0 subunit 8 n=1 Tax=Phryganopsyche latipennis TaxID=177652 RepID=A0A4Y1JWN8_9NEOP|nr:ATP synthase F0 subunit 8 [Phryganopsyche latipennis]APQ47893.1 ATP synthase F0 subunit 8 [Phryganopsyche latipennis]
MPQMMPLNWIMLFVYFLFMFYLFIIMNYFISSPENNFFLTSTKKINKFSWTW